jgi:hypothetical protein
MFYIRVCICLFLCICLSFGTIFHAWEKTCDFVFFEPDLLHLTWCPPIASTCWQTTSLFFVCGLSPNSSFTHLLDKYWSRSYHVPVAQMGTHLRERDHHSSSPFSPGQCVKFSGLYLVLRQPFLAHSMVCRLKAIFPLFARMWGFTVCPWVS